MKFIRTKDFDENMTELVDLFNYLRTPKNLLKTILLSGLCFSIT